jgi:hypothetical protein
MKKFKTDLELCDWIKFQSEDDEVLIIDGFCEEFVGLQRNEDGDDVAVYDEKGIIQKLINQGVNEEDAHAHFYLKILGLHLGPRTPKFIHIAEPEIPHESSLS